MSQTDELKPGVRVKVKGTSREDINEKEGFIQEFTRDSGRFNVLLDNGKLVALRPENIEAQSPMSMGTMKFLFNNLKKEIAEKGVKKFVLDGVDDISGKVEAVLPPSLRQYSGKTVLGGALVFSLLMMILLGFLRGFLLTNILFMGLVIGAPEYERNGGGVAGAKAAFVALKTNFKNHISTSFGINLGDMAVNIALLALLVAISMSLFPSLLSTGASVTAGSQGPFGQSSQHGSSMSAHHLTQIKSAFKAGFEAGDLDEDLDASLEKYMLKISDQIGSGSASSEQDSSDVSSPEYFEDYEMKQKQSQTTRGSALFGLDKIVPLVFSGKLIFDLGGGRNWNAQTAMQNFQNEPVWKRALIIFGITRIFF